MKGKLKNTKFLVTTGLLAALACVATMAIKVPTPTMGYIHLGDGLVLLCGFILGPVYGGLAAGIGSMFADLLNGYAIWAPGTFIIKALTAFTAGMLYRGMRKAFTNPVGTYATIIISGIAGEACMVIGYFLYNILVISITNGAFDGTSVAAAIVESAAEIPFNLVQGFAGIVIAVILVPILGKIQDVRNWMSE